MDMSNFKIGRGYISRVCIGEIEVIRRIFVTVRDRNWREIAPAQFQAEPDPEVPGKMNFHARHTGDGIDFEWQGFLRVQDEAHRCMLDFAFEGHARCNMTVCRLGLVVLHPVDSLIGNRLVVDGVEGRQEVVLSRYIHPQPINEGIPQGLTRPFTHLSMEMAQLGPVNFTFTGDHFEFEDQRNWGDASFKTYCTPLRLGFPRLVKAGTMIAQTMRVSVEANSSRPRTDIISPIQERRPVPMVAPKIGRVAPACYRTLADARWAEGWDHIRVDMETATDSRAIESLLAVLPATTTLELGVTVDEAQGLADCELELVSRCCRRIFALLVRSASSPLPSSKVIARLRDQLRSTPAYGIPLLAMPNGYFVEFNRGALFQGDVDGIAFPLSPTVHSDDAETITENIPTIIDMVRTGRHLSGKAIISISPLALYHPPSTSQNRLSPSLLVPFVTRVIACATSSGISSLTLAEDVANGLTSGPAGIAH